MHMTHGSNRTLDSHGTTSAKIALGFVKGFIVTASALAAGLVMWATPQSAWAATIPVTTETDEYNTNPGACSLREAVTAANTDAAFDGCPAGSGDDVIVIPSGTYTLSLTGANEDANLTGDLDITTTIVFSGAGSGSTIVDGLSQDRVFHVAVGNIDLNLNGLTVQNGSVSASGGGAAVTDGGAVLSDTAFLSNTSSSVGGGLYATGNVTLTNSLFRNNSVLGTGFLGGGGLYTVNGGAVLSNTPFIANSATGSGGGMYAAQHVVVDNSPFERNSTTMPFFIIGASANGGGLYTQQTASLQNSPFISNTAVGLGGGVYATQGITVVSSPFSNNQSFSTYFLLIFGVSGGGGGAYIPNGTAYITDSPFIANAAQGIAGGIYAALGGTLIDSPFISNTSTAYIVPLFFTVGANGGGAYFGGATLISGSDFINNNSQANGGGLVAAQSINIQGSDFISNTASLSGGGIMAYQSISVTNASFMSNTTLSTGGGLYASQAAAIDRASFIGNTSSNTGGGLVAMQGITLTHSTISNNRSVLGFGGGVYADVGTAMISQTAFISNASNFGGGAFFGSDQSIILNSLFAANVASNGASAIHIEGLTKTLTLTHATIAQPGVGTGTAILVTGTNSSALIQNTIIASHTVGVEVAAGNTGVEDYNLFFGNTTDRVGIAAGPNSLVGDPAFVDPLNNDYHVTYSSAALSGGIDLGITPDYDGNSRPSGIAPTIGFVELADLPVAGLAATNDSPELANASVQLTATITGGSRVSYTWEFGDGQTGTGLMPTHSYAVPGFYTATVTATNSTNSLVATTLVTIKDMPIAGLAASNSSPQAVNTAVQFAAIVLGGNNVNYVWAFGDGQTGAGAMPTHSYATAGTYTAIVTATNLGSSASATTQVIITTTNAEVAIAGLAAANSSPQQVNTAVQFTATVTAGTNVSYAWDFGDGQTGAGAMPTHSYTVAGTYAAIVTATNAANTAATTTQVVITANNTEVAIAGLAATNDSPEQVNMAVQFTATVTAGTNVSYTWDFGDGQMGAGATPTHSYAVAGTYAAIVTATNRLGNVSANTMVSITGPATNELAGVLSATFAGDQITYTLQVSNPNPSMVARNVVLSGSLPAGTTLVSSNGSFSVMGGDYGNGYVQLSPRNLNPGEQVTLTWTVTTPNRTNNIVTRGHATSDNAQITQGLVLNIYRVLIQVVLKEAPFVQMP